MNVLKGPTGPKTRFSDPIVETNTFAIDAGETVSVLLDCGADRLAIGGGFKGFVHEGFPDGLPSVYLWVTENRHDRPSGGRKWHISVINMEKPVPEGNGRSYRGQAQAYCIDA